MRGAMLFAAGLFVGVAVHVGLAQSAGRGGAAGGVVMMNHVAINVPNIDEAVTYYTQKMGYREAFRAHDDKGQVRLVYMQISKNTFLELQPVTPQRRQDSITTACTSRTSPRRSRDSGRTA